MTDGRVIDLLELLYARSYVMFGEDKEIERLIKELRETMSRDESLKTTRIVSKERDEEDRA